MRYEVGTPYPFLRIDFKPSEARFSMLYLPWTDTLNAILLINLDCVEHHRVPGEWDDEIQYDGFIFARTLEDGTVERWVNQYPKAAYSQTSTEADWVVTQKEFIPDTDLGDYTAAHVVLERILRGVRDFSPGSGCENEECKTALEKHFQELVETLNDAGWNVINQPRVRRYTDGRPEE